mgnify:CR=1 FL=1
MPEQPITREWLEAELALCAEKSAGGKYPALLQWALAALERERRLREALQRFVTNAQDMSLNELGARQVALDDLRRAKALLEEASH